MRIEINCKYCGTPFEVVPSSTQQYCSRSCGSRKARWSFHGLTNTPEHRIWRRMRRRCYSSQYHCYARYGGRGIKICDRWNEFKYFLEDMGPRPGPRFSIERINNDGDYEPSNCKWATQLEQCRNKSNTYTDAEDELIRSGIEQGMNTPQIAKLIPCRTEKGVVARLYRLGLKSGQPPRGGS